ncbi:hypothetical protein MLD38_031890 [Melastoma candidum]|uniref:Uncharacterized protein n=1 Tax=Melastoma candidum TaxID=119954 RepID=A0ACB9MQG5_9MYRT|nr:hypothetical protein MLD38_031890 [Melastoma candidum]
MKSSQDEEECRSSESGWTMYLGSPTEDSGSTDGEDDNDDEQDQEAEEQSDCDNVGSIHGEGEEEDHEVRNEDDDCDGKGRDSDDSMASDASSRPHCPGFWAKSDEKGQQGKGTVHGRGKVRKNLKVGKK